MKTIQLGKLKPFPALNLNPTPKATFINLSDLETYLLRCHSLRQFNQLLSQMISTGLINDTYAASRLIKRSTDSPFIRLHYSRQIFDHLVHPNEFTWNTMMRAHLQAGPPQTVMGLYKLMLESDVAPDNYTHPILVQACGLRLSELEGRESHGHVLKMGFDSDVYVQNTLITMYAVCRNLGDARKLFDESPVLDLVSWNSILAGYVQSGEVEAAKLIYGRMPRRNIIASNSMIALLGKAGLVSDAYQLFNKMPERDMISWSALVSCLEKNRMYEDALSVFRNMRANGLMVDEVVVVSVLSASGSLLVLKMGNSIHGLAVKVGIESYVNLKNALIHMYTSCGDILSAQKLFDSTYQLDQISWNSMISGYMKCGSVENAQKLFDSMPVKDIVSWSAMISGYCQHNQFSETLGLFHEMQLEEVMPDEATLVSVVSACAHLAALEQGKWIHAYIRKNELKINAVLGTTLIDMYMKCGCTKDAMEVFYGMDEKGVSSWNAVIVGLSLNGKVESSLEMLTEMKRSGVVPNEITFVGILGACRHMGLVDEGRRHFSSMIQEHKIEPNVKHYGCMVDLLGRAGFLKEAEELVTNMPMAPDVPTWGALLGACKKHGDKEMGERVGRKLIELQPEHDGFHVLLSNISASKGNWNHVLEIRGMMMERGVVKTPGCSIIEANGVIHEFLAGDRAHPRLSEIEKMLDEMAKRLKLEGYRPDMTEVSLEIDEEEKETTLFRHSEKLAIAFGLITTSPPTPIRIMKNLRICNDCHEAAKLTSRAFDREIVVRDQRRFHHFKNGYCSCMDYW